MRDSNEALNSNIINIFRGFLPYNFFFIFFTFKLHIILKGSNCWDQITYFFLICSLISSIKWFTDGKLTRSSLPTCFLRYSFQPS